MCRNRFNKKLIFLFVFGFLLNSQFINAQKHKYQNLKIDFDEVRAYLFDGKHGNRLVNNGILDSNVIDKKGYVLNRKQILLFDNYLTEFKLKKVKENVKVSDRDFCDQARCFSPHHGLVFFKHNKIVGQASLCFECNRMASDFIIYKGCIDGFIVLFNSFDLKVNNKSFDLKNELFDLEEAIESFIKQKYGKKNYNKNRNQSIDY